MSQIKQRSRCLIADKSKNEESKGNVNLEEKPKYRREIVWFSVAKIVFIHLLTLVAFSLIPFASNGTILFNWSLLLIGKLGIQIGAHRLWTHRTFKATFSLRLLFAACQTAALQNDIYVWARDHRVHHKWSDTDADPHNSNRGFFFSHMGWLMVKKHPDVVRKGATLDLSDLEADPIVRWQRKPYYYLWVIIFWAAIPTFIPVLGWGESIVVAFFLCTILRCVITLHVTWLVNSWAHIWGYRPYNKDLVPVEASSIRHVIQGEGFHNYHHAFPQDYSTSELGAADVYNPATALIDLFAYLGWAWDLKKPDQSTIEKAIKSKGDPGAVQYERGHGLREWAGGLAVSTFIVWGFLAYKYTILYFYFKPDDPMPNFDSLYLYPLTKFLIQVV